MKILLNGFGRIGRAIARILIESNLEGKIFVHNRTYNPELFTYLLQYDSIYGRLKAKTDVKSLRFNNFVLEFISNNELKEILKRKSERFDFLIDTAPKAYLSYTDLISKKFVKKVIISHMSENADFTCVFGVNENLYDKHAHNIVSIGICDVVAFAPILNFLNKTYGIKSGTVLTIHPWLAYQNLLDNTSIGYMETSDYGLYRSAIDNLIPKSTSAIEANLTVLPELRGKIDGFTIRVPTSSVTSGNLSLILDQKVKKEQLVKGLKKFVSKNETIKLNDQPFVSKDFQKTEYSCIVDLRFIKLMPSNLIQLMLWYDNEWGYSYRIFDFIKLHIKK